MKTSSKFHKALRSKRKVLPLIKLMDPGSSPPDTGALPVGIRIARFDADCWLVTGLGVQVAGPGRFDRLLRENPFTLRPDPVWASGPAHEYVDARLGNRTSLTFEGALRRGDSLILTHSPGADHCPQDYWSELPLAVSAPSCELSRTFVHNPHNRCVTAVHGILLRKRVLTVALGLYSLGTQPFVFQTPAGGCTLRFYLQDGSFTETHRGRAPRCGGARCRLLLGVRSQG